jgi:N-acetylglucosaminyl-diphospho-decaprenol L-rhamnosyltransferase
MNLTDAAGGPAVSILVVGYNSQPFLADALDAVPLAAQRSDCEIRFVNNGDDRSEEFVGARYSNAVVLPSHGNIGFGAANNYLAREATGEWLLLLNPDTILEPHAIDIMLDQAKSQPEFGIIGGLSVSRKGDALAMSRLEFPSLGSIFRGAIGLGGGRQLPVSDTKILQVDAVSGCFLLIRRRTWEELGGFDERFFLYAEELDLCRRLHNSGGMVGIAPGARVVHDVGSGNAGAPARLLFSMRGSATYYRKHFSPAYAHACLLLHWLSCAGRYVAGSVLSPFNRRYKALALALAMREVTLKPWLWYGGYQDRRGSPDRTAR